MKTKDFIEYCKGRLSREEIDEIKQKAEKEVERLMKIKLEEHKKYCHPECPEQEDNDMSEKIIERGNELYEAALQASPTKVLLSQLLNHNTFITRLIRESDIDFKDMESTNLNGLNVKERETKEDILNELEAVTIMMFKLLKHPRTDKL